MDKEFFSPNISSDLLDYYLRAAKYFKDIAENIERDHPYCDSIKPEDVFSFDNIPFNNREHYICFLRLKYVYFLSIKQSKKATDLFLHYGINDTNMQKRYLEIFDVWDNGYINLEANVLLLRYYQLHNCALEYWYNDLQEFVEWFNYIKSSDEIKSELDTKFMGEHNLRNLGDINHIQLNDFIQKCTYNFFELRSSSEHSDKAYIREFLKVISDVFDVELVDYLKVVEEESKKYVKYYVDSFDSIKFASESVVRENDDSYLMGKGISGSILVCNNKDRYVHVGTNDLELDLRQSGTHCSWYENEYKINIKSYWIFPIFDESGCIIGVFRIMNKKPNITTNSWNYTERATLLEVARWYEKYGKDEINMALQKDEFADAENNELYRRLEISWFDKKQFVTMMTHLKSLAHKKIERHSAGVCFAVVEKTIINRFIATSIRYPIQSSILNTEVLLESDSLDKLSLLYKAMNPLSSFCLFSSDGCFYGVRKINNNIDRIENVRNITHESENSIAFLAQGEEKTIRIYKEGKLYADYYLSESNGEWRFRKFSDFEKVLDKTNIDKGIVRGVTELIFELSLNKIGSMIVFSNKSAFKSDEVNGYAEIKEDCYIVGDTQAVVYWASIDGALLCTCDGKLTSLGKILKTDKNKELDKYFDDLINRHQKGSRHRTAAFYAQENNDDCVIVISENKGISVLYKGQDAVWDDKINPKFNNQRGNSMIINPEPTLEKYGGKGYQLLKLKEISLVPDFFVLCFDSADCINEPSIQEQILSFFRSSGYSNVSVRSSATVEDSVSASFAGVFETVLNVNETSLINSIKKVIESASSDRVIKYCESNRIKITSVEMRVIVQKMINSRVSGVCFTNESKALESILIEACYGLGEALVSGEISPDTYHVERNSLNIVSKSVEHQSNMLDSTTNGKYIQVPFNKRNAQKLTDSEIKKLAEKCMEIEKKLGYASADIEWAYVDNELYMLQVRPYVAYNNS